MEWVTRFSRAGMMGLAWAAVWLLPGMVAGQLIVGELEPEHIGGPLYAGVLSGALFCAVAGLASGRRRLGDLSIARAAASGALAGAAIGALPFLIGDQHAPGERPLWVLPVALIISLAVLSALSASVSVAVARLSNKQNVHEHLA